MRVFLAGATGVIGQPLVPALIAGGHHVTGMTRSPAKADDLRAAGAEPLVADALDAEAVMSAVKEARPDAVIHQLTAIPQRLDPRRIERDFALTDRLRSEGTRHLVAAAQRAACDGSSLRASPSPTRRVPPASCTARRIRWCVTPAKPFRRSARALAELERTVLGAGGLVLRYGYFYGPRCGISRTGAMSRDVQRRRLPIVGSGSAACGRSSTSTMRRARPSNALTHGEPGLTTSSTTTRRASRNGFRRLAEALGAKRPFRVPAALARLAAGDYGVAIMTRSQGASNARAKAELVLGASALELA